MNETIKIIDLLNKIANGEIKEGQRFNIKFGDMYRECYFTIDEDKGYCGGLDFFKNCRNNDSIYDSLTLNEEVEIIEEESEINIQEIEETEIKNDGRMDYFEYCNDGATESGYGVNYSKSDIATRKIINELIEAIKQLDKKIKEK